MAWDDVVKRWLPLVEEMERMGFEDYAIPEIFRAAEARIARLIEVKAHFRAELEAAKHDYEKIRRLQKENAALRANVSKSVLRRLDAQLREE